jgi:NADH dehydrogenase/NADH:ubiquinone oxidoreductase subunit G
VNTLNESDLLDPFERLITIEILGRRVRVPEKNRLLRCFQYLSLETISYGDFCWNGDCTNCQVWFTEEGRPAEAPRPGLACRTDAREGMVITRLSPHIKIEGVNE